MQDITSPQNPAFKLAMQLHSSRGRKKQNRIIIFGIREVLRAMDHTNVMELYLLPDSLSESEMTKLNMYAAKNNIRSYSLTEALFSKLSYGDRVEGAIAIAERPETRLEDLELTDDSLVVVVESIEKPGNIGALLRTMDAVSASALVLADSITDVFHPNSIRNSMGASFSVPIAEDTTPNIQAWLVQNGIRVFVAMVDGAGDFYQCDLKGSIAIVLGNESKGLDKSWAQQTFHPVRLPMSGITDSLNISVTAAVMLFESFRQRNYETPNLMDD